MPGNIAEDNLFFLIDEVGKKSSEHDTYGMIIKLVVTNMKWSQMSQEVQYRAITFNGSGNENSGYSYKDLLKK